VFYFEQEIHPIAGYRALPRDAPYTCIWMPRTISKVPGYAHG